SGIAMSLVAYVLGARVIEKHFTLNRAMKGTDHAFSLEPIGFSKMVRDIKRTSLALGDGIKTVYDSEKAPLMKMGKSIYFSRDLSAGDIVTIDDLSFKSPAKGKAPFEADSVLGKKLRKKVLEDEIVTDDLFE
ncbi:MAG: N-acetylneuraminate synthase family protein, partial [Candidatus Fonsibacter sp.]